MGTEDRVDHGRLVHVEVHLELEHIERALLEMSDHLVAFGAPVFRAHLELVTVGMEPAGRLGFPEQLLEYPAQGILDFTARVPWFDPPGERSAVLGPSFNHESPPATAARIPAG